MSDLKPCPFCGSEAEVEAEGTHKRSHIIRCTECGASLETGEEGAHRGQQWNTRTSGWQPIETAPKGEVEFDAWALSGIGEFGFKLTNCWHCPDQGFGCMDDYGETFITFDQMTDTTNGGCIDKITHWHPIVESRPPELKS